MIGRAMARPVVVLVDDDPAVAHALNFSFDLEGFEVLAYREREVLLAAADLPKHGCLVLNHHLPNLDGLRLLARLRAASVAMPAILVATNPRRSLRLRAATAGAPIIEKPLLTDALLTAVRRAMLAAP